MRNILILVIGLFLLTGCQSKSLHYAPTFPSGVKIVADELSKGMLDYRNHKLVLTSLVDLNNFKESSNFGRLFSESLMTQMTLRGNHVIEFRGDDIVTKTQHGEFKLNRARIQSIEDKDILILVGTYSKMDDSVIVNVRIIEKNSNILVSAASAYIPFTETQKPKIIKEKDKFMVQLVPSRCSKSEYCWKDLDE
ncbi:hypothetical protein KKG72_01060 [bacterium]|nr:hypothetical protein [bacterium]MBU1994924.1 hypothetical protein [bacterium]